MANYYDIRIFCRHDASGTSDRIRVRSTSTSYVVSHNDNVQTSMLQNVGPQCARFLIIILILRTALQTALQSLSRSLCKHGHAHGVVIRPFFYFLRSHSLKLEF